MIYFLLTASILQSILIISIGRSVDRLAKNQIVFAKMLTEIRSQR